MKSAARILGGESGVEWTQFTWNWMRGCTAVSPACDKCYMFADQRRYGHDPTVVTRAAPGTFRKPLKIEREHPGAMVFSCSWGDWFHVEGDPWRSDAWDIVRATPTLKHQILTKRHGRITRSLPADWGSDGYANVSLGVTAENQQWADARVPELLRVPGKRIVRFVSYGPALGPVDFTCLGPDKVNALVPSGSRPALDWVVIEGESNSGYGPPVRSCEFDWSRRVVEQCVRHDVPVFFKQAGARPTDHGNLVKLQHRKGADLTELPSELQVRQFPRAYGDMSQVLR